MDPTETGKLIRKKRKVLSMTQQELAEKVYVEKATVSAWETGKIYPSMQSQMLLYQVLGVNPLELMTGRVMRDQKLKKDVEEFIMKNTDRCVIVIHMFQTKEIDHADRRQVIVFSNPFHYVRSRQTTCPECVYQNADRLFNPNRVGKLDLTLSGKPASKHIASISSISIADT